MLSGKSINMSLNDMSVGKLGNHFMEVQHPSLKQALTTFSACCYLISAIDEKEPKTKIISIWLAELERLLKQHLEQDEKILFPYLRAKIDDGHNTSNVPPLSYRIVQGEHVIIRNLFNNIRLMSDQYTAPEGSTATLKLCYAHTFNFEQDMFRHIFLEDDILLPKLLSNK
jgi:regulator of cell morphogenesis and NO signaling